MEATSDKPKEPAGITSGMKFDPETFVPKEDTPQARFAVRRESLVRMRATLWKYADASQGAFPESLP
ncbi:MAG: hypothetical protein FWC50_10735 [Planctomycetaceae bacterium]|nr:hypothetical protein [Planctomycetaceae bacterium]